ncbi:AAA family ATPase [Allorhizocola rhizosphaerae]|uniref:AAA family ATPase n=1 Tax=Allorhizocola rhizosphaerae TaxID=1872709 RepID=UPI001B8C7BFE|nr:AAA family ATPase [Allorhizocola rhizosphaerae]
MYLAKVKIDDIRGFRGPRRVDLDLARHDHDSYAGWTVLVGPDGAGKTTLLQAIALALAGPPVAPVLRPADWTEGGVELDLAPEDVYVGVHIDGSEVSAESNVAAPPPWHGRMTCVGYGADRRAGQGSGAHPLAGLFRDDVTLWGEPPQDLPHALRPLVADLSRQVQGPGVVLIDEVELHLHPTWQQRIGDWLTERFPQLQFIVTTNSPYVCQSASPSGLIHLPDPAEQRAPYAVDGDTYRRVVFGSGEDIVLSGLFGLDSPYSSRARALRRELVELELKVLEGTASQIQQARYRELQELLVSSPVTRSRELAALLDKEKARRGTK